jgi:26S proteasome regulatory subunit T6
MSSFNNFPILTLNREHSPSIIFMDEIDSIGSTRIDSGSGGGDSEVQRTMLELLNQLDGFESTQNIKVSCFFSSQEKNLTRTRC